MMMRKVSGAQARQLLHNKFVVVLGASVQRGMYKDLVHLLQNEDYLDLRDLKTKGELSFEGDCLVEGGRLGQMHNGTAYREVRQFKTDHHLVRFYFLTRIYSPYMISVLEDFRRGPPPDVIFVNSCLWDISRYGGDRLQEYRDNLQKFFMAVKEVVSEDCLVVWLLSMPLGDNIRGGFLVPEVQHLGPTLRFDVIEANFDAARLAAAHGLDVLDLHYNFRLSLQHRMDDNTHWNQVAHRLISWLLLRHTAEAWGVDLWGSGSSGLPANLGQQWTVNWPGGDRAIGDGPRSTGGNIQQLTYNREDFGRTSYVTGQQNMHNNAVDRWSQQKRAGAAEAPGLPPCTKQSEPIYQALLDLVQIVRENKGSTSSFDAGQNRRPEDTQTAAVAPQLDFTNDPVLPIDGEFHNPDWNRWQAAMQAEGYGDNSLPSWQSGVRANVRLTNAPQNAGFMRPVLSREVTLSSHPHSHVIRRRRQEAPARVHPYAPHHRPSSHHQHYGW